MSKVIGCVHGRFQPVHLEHEEYIFEALNRCDHLIVGITQYENDSLINCEVDPHRSVIFNNPLSYQERISLIDLLFKSKDIPAERYSFSRFPIDQPEKMHEFISQTIKCFTTIVEDWNTEKVNRLKEYGYEVEVLWDRVGFKGISASQLRALALRKDPLWRKLVSPAVAKGLDDLDFENRLEELVSKD